MIRINVLEELIKDKSVSEIIINKLDPIFKHFKQVFMFDNEPVDIKVIESIRTSFKEINDIAADKSLESFYIEDGNINKDAMDVFFNFIHK